jgi:chromosome partitioning protein
VVLVGLAELAELFGVTKQVVTNWRSRKSGFPEPIADLKSGPVWSLDAMRAWAKLADIPLAQAQKKRSPTSRRAATVAAFMNMKGGVGKSTLAANLGWYAAYEGNKRTLLVDLDPQFNLSQYILGLGGVKALFESKAPTIDRLFRPGAEKERVAIRDIIQEVHDWNDGTCLHLLPSTLDLAWTIRNAPTTANLLRDSLLEVKDEYDLIIIDCAPTDSVLSDAAYMAADYIFVPVRPEFLSAIGLPLLLESMERFQSAHPTLSIPTFGGIIFNDATDSLEHAKARKNVLDVAKQHGLHVFRSQISHSNSYAAGSRLGKPIFMTDYARSARKNEFNHVAQEFMERMKH